MLTFRGWHRIRHPHTPTLTVSFHCCRAPYAKRITLDPLDTRANSALGLIDLTHSLPFEIIETLLLVWPPAAHTLNEPTVHSPHIHAQTHTQFSSCKANLLLVWSLFTYCWADNVVSYPSFARATKNLSVVSSGSVSSVPSKIFTPSHERIRQPAALQKTRKKHVYTSQWQRH